MPYASYGMEDAYPARYEGPGVVFWFFASVLTLYLILGPFYIFPQGTPQPADYILFFFGFPLLIISLFSGQGRISRVMLFGILFAGLTVLINMIHFYFLPDIRFFRHSLYYVYNFSAFMFITILFQQQPRLTTKLIYTVVAMTVVLQFFYAPLFGEMEHIRNNGSFNNPNQLSYWSLLSLAILIILKRDKPLNLIDVVLFGMIFYLQTLALSKAGLIISALIAPIIIMLPNIPKGGRAISIFIVIIAMMTQLFDPGRLQSNIQQIEQFNAVVERLANIGTEKDDSAEGRGYMRIIDNPHFLIFGAGEGGNLRFGFQELHSGLGTLIFSYGIVGLTFFLMFLFAVFYRLPWRYIAIVFLIMLFGIPHQNVRFTYFWVFLAVAYSHNFYRTKEEEDLMREEARILKPGA